MKTTIVSLRLVVAAAFALLTTVACTAAPMTHGDASGLLGGGLRTLFVLLITD